MVAASKAPRRTGQADRFLLIFFLLFLKRPWVSLPPE
jgi:hypothetical protein